MLDISKEEGRKAQELLQTKYGTSSSKFIQCDVTRSEDLAKATKQVISDYGRLDVLRNNSGIIDEENWEKCIDVNLSGVIRGTKLGLETMNTGIIVNTASINGVTLIEMFPAYSATKHGIVGFTRSIAPVAMATKGIRVNCICPAGVLTPLVMRTAETLMKDTVVDMEVYKEQMDLLMKPEVVAEGLIDIILDDTKNGEAMVILPPATIGYQLFNEPGVFKTDNEKE